MSLINMKISARLAWAFGLVMVGFAAMAGYSWYAVNSLADEWVDFNTHIQARIRITTDMTRQNGTTIHFMRDYMLRGADYDQKFFGSLDVIDKQIALYRVQPGQNPEEGEFLNKMTAAGESLRGTMRQLQQMRARGVDAVEMDRAFMGVDEKMTVPIGQLRDLNRRLMAGQGVRINNLAKTNEMLIPVIAIPLMLLLAITGLLISRAITRPLRQAITAAGRVAAGDLTEAVQTRRRDEVGELLVALGTMNDSLRRIVGDVRGGAEMVAAACKEIANGNSELSMRTEEQASSLEEAAASLEQFTATVKQNADNAKLASQLAEGASTVADKGGQVVDRVVATMGSINESSKKIADIISVIDGIAFQTNILALNAAVEAARAGEQGRGFAVVASEVRSLAQRSAVAAKEIKGLIGESVDKVENGTKLVGEAGKTMMEIVVGIQQVAQIIAEISAASQEQRAGIEQVSEAVSQMDRVTQQNAALVEESAAAAESLQQQAAALAESVRVFKLGEEAPQPVARPHQPPPADRRSVKLAPARAPSGMRLGVLTARGKLGEGGWQAS